MKKIVILLVVLCVGVSISIVLFSRPSDYERATKAEQRGKYLEAQQLYIQEILKLTESMAYPQRDIEVTASEAEWKQSVERYMAWVNFSIADTREQYTQALSGIVRCSSFVEQVNFITHKQPKALSRDILAREWHDAFVRLNKADAQEQQPLLSRVWQDSMSVLCIRALSGYIYRIKLLDVMTGKRTDFFLYPNSSIILLVKPRKYYVICSSEVQFTDVLTAKNWNSSETVISLSIPNQPTLKSITLKTQVRRTKK